MPPNATTTALIYSIASTPITIAPRAGLLIQVSDWAGRQLNLTWTAQERIATLTRLPLHIAESKRLTTFVYDTHGNATGKSLQATSDSNGSLGLSPPLVGSARTWTPGQVTTLSNYDANGRTQMVNCQLPQGEKAFAPVGDRNSEPPGER